LITECWAFAGPICYVGSRERNAFIPVNSVKILQVVEAEEEEIAVPLPMTVGRARSSGISRMRRRPAAGASSQSVPEAEPSDDGNGEEEGGEDGNYYVAKGSKKKASKKHEREARREVRQHPLPIACLEKVLISCAFPHIPHI
jgi:hypothetical protein